MGALPPLATVGDLANHLQTKIANSDASARYALQVASGFARRAARFQVISRVVDDVVVLDGDRAQLVLPQRPVVEVSGITGLASSAWALAGDVLTLTAATDWASKVAITYTHGYDPIPDEVIGVVCAVAARIRDNPRGRRAGQRQVGNFSESATYADGGAGGLLTQELDIMRAYGRRSNAALPRG